MNYFLEKTKKIEETTEKVNTFLNFVRDCEPFTKLEYPEEVFQPKEKTEIDRKIEELNILVEEFKEKYGINKAIRRFYIAIPRLIKAMKAWKKKQRRVR